MAGVRTVKMLWFAVGRAKSGVKKAIWRFGWKRWEGLGLGGGRARGPAGGHVPGGGMGVAWRGRWLSLDAGGPCARAGGGRGGLGDGWQSANRESQKHKGQLHAVGLGWALNPGTSNNLTSNSGGESGIRTPDPRIMIPLL